MLSQWILVKKKVVSINNRTLFLNCLKRSFQNEIYQDLKCTPKPAISDAAEPRGYWHGSQQQTATSQGGSHIGSQLRCHLTRLLSRMCSSVWSCLWSHMTYPYGNTVFWGESLHHSNSTFGQMCIQPWFKRHLLQFQEVLEIRCVWSNVLLVGLKRTKNTKCHSLRFIHLFYGIISAERIFAGVCFPGDPHAATHAHPVLVHSAQKASAYTYMRWCRRIMVCHLLHTRQNHFRPHLSLCRCEKQLQTLRPRLILSDTQTFRNGWPYPRSIATEHQPKHRWIKFTLSFHHIHSYPCPPNTDKSCELEFRHSDRQQTPDVCVVTHSIFCSYCFAVSCWAPGHL